MSPPRHQPLGLVQACRGRRRGIHPPPSSSIRWAARRGESRRAARHLAVQRRTVMQLAGLPLAGEGAVGPNRPIRQRSADSSHAVSGRTLPMMSLHRGPAASTAEMPAVPAPVPPRGEKRRRRHQPPERAVDATPVRHLPRPRRPVHRRPSGSEVPRGQVPRPDRLINKDRAKASTCEAVEVRRQIEKGLFGKIAERGGTCPHARRARANARADPPTRSWASEPLEPLLRDETLTRSDGQRSAALHRAREERSRM